jgi:hypothetical protein
LLAKRSSTLISLEIRENGSLVFFLYLEVGSGGRGGSIVLVVVTLVTTFLTLTFASESLDDEESAEESEEDDFFARSDNVALVSEPCFLIFFGGESAEDSLPELELDDSESESGKGIFWATEFVEESESDEESDEESDDDPEVELLSEELEDELAAFFSCFVFFTFLFFFFFLESEAEESEDESLELDDDEDEEDESEDESNLVSVFIFFDLGASSSELEPELESDPDDELLEGALRFRFLIFGFGEEDLTLVTSFSSSASLSDPLEDDEEGDLRASIFLAGGESNISTSLSPLSLLTRPRYRCQ